MNIKDVVKLTVLIPPVVIAAILLSSGQKPRADGVGNSVYKLLNELPQYQKVEDLPAAIEAALANSKSDEEKSLIFLSRDVFKSIFFTPKDKTSDCSLLDKNQNEYGVYLKTSKVILKNCEAKVAGQVLRCSVDHLTQNDSQEDWENCLDKWSKKD